jgi:hypothetical protein|tara:strand:+ start:1278 stop:1463 length:186 start_codon:yes stop_codon:yes gene_type:complete
MFSWIFNSNTNDDLHFVNDMITFYNEKFKSINTHNISEEQKEIKKKRIAIIVNCLKYYYNL